MTLLADPVAKSRERFVRETAEHEMTVVHDEGLYRHLRFQKPGTSFYLFDLVTWPGYLAVVGDCGDYVFSRTRDMFEFFGPSGARGGFEDVEYGINPHYWGEKLRGPKPGRESAKSYSHEAFTAQLYQWCDEQVELAEWDGEPMYADLIRAAVDRELLADHTHFEEEARERLRDKEDEVGYALFTDLWEWDLREYDWSFLWCCWAIVWGIEQYRAAAPAPPPTEAPA